MTQTPPTRLRLSSLAALACTLGLLMPSLTAAAPEKASPENASPKVPLKKVVLFNSGVGYFEHAGKVEGDAQVELKFNVDDINDLLKSMVVQDLDGGRISTVSYGSKDPITKTLKTFAIDLTKNPTLAQLLGRIRGERVLIEAPNEITGVILGVERRKRKVGKDETIEFDVLNLLTDEGLRSISLESASRITLLNPKLDAELRKTLALLASAHATDKKSVSLDFLGEGARRVRVGYIQETPIWKTTYRLVLSDDDSALLQGWAIVENTTEEDWSNVELTLVSGRPISFVMDLYEPLYIPRPEVQLSLYASLRPRVHGGAITGERKYTSMDLALRNKSESKKAKLARRAPSASAENKAVVGYLADKFELDEGVVIERLAESVRSAAAAGNVGELFQYVIATPVDLSRQKSAMLPIVNAQVKGEKVSIYNPGVHAKHPLCGLRLTNSTDLHLMQGPITVFDGGVYAGDARIEDLPPAGERLISYAMDLDTEVVPESKGRPELLLSVRLVKGTMIATRKYSRIQKYVVKNSGRKTKKVLVEHAFDPAWTLIAPKEPTEKTRDRYRFAVEAKSGEPTELVVEEERTVRQQIALANVGDDVIRYCLSAKVVSDEVKTALTEIVRRKTQLGKVVEERKQLEKRIGVIAKEQARIRENMKQLDRASELYKRYVKKFTDQEDDVERCRVRIGALVGQETELRRALGEYLMKLDL